MRDKVKSGALSDKFVPHFDTFRHTDYSVTGAMSFLRFEKSKRFDL